MDLRLERFHKTETATIGHLWVDGENQCLTLEDVVRDHKIKNETAIPAGIYQIVISWSPRFKKLLPLLLNVPAYAGIRIHPGNAPKDTSGCILVGRTWQKGESWIGESRAAFDALFEKLEAAAKKERIVIEIVDKVPA